MQDAAASDSFLPRIQSVFYAIFDVRQGPKIVHQVPEGLVAVSPTGLSLPTPSPVQGTAPHTPSSETLSTTTQTSALSSSGSSRTSLTSPEPDPCGRSLGSSYKQSSTASVLFNFDEISKYVIPPPALCGRLVTCSTKRHRIIGFPCELQGKYQRNYFRYNLCFVFDRGADLRCYEPIVRKISRVLTSCEEESGFLSSPNNASGLHAILEQLYEDLNSYSETSIAIDDFNSLELKIFPYYPNPTTVRDWMVPLALINITKRMEDNWDLTMLKVCKFIDGVNHVSRIAHLADCDKELTRLAIAHLLYYQVIMVIDIFQFSNMYTLRKSIQWLANEPHVRDECGPYVTKPGRPIPDWPQLLHLYSRLKSGTTVLEWMQTYNVTQLGIDVRRFVSFGVIKGFLRRVHRWPVFLILSSTSGDVVQTTQTGDSHVPSRRRGKSVSSMTYGVVRQPGLDGQTSEPSTIRGRPAPTGIQDTTSSRIPSQGIGPLPANGAAGVGYVPASSGTIVNVSATQRARRASAAEKFLEQLRNKDLQRTGTASMSTSPRTTWMHKPKEEGTRSRAASLLASVTGTTGAPAPADHHPLMTQAGVGHGSPVKNLKSSPENRNILPVVPPPSPVIPKATIPPVARSRISRSPSAPYLAQPAQHAVNTVGQASHTKGPPKELIPLLDGDHHTDELAVRFEVGWPQLEQWLISIGGGEGNGDYGRLSMIYR